MASVSCASALMEPKHIAPVTKRLAISEAGSTSSSGTGVARVASISSSPRRVVGESWASTARS